MAYNVTRRSAFSFLVGVLGFFLGGGRGWVGVVCLSWYRLEVLSLFNNV